MKRLDLYAVTALSAVVWASVPVVSAAQQSDQIAAHSDVLTRYCVTCHNARAKTGGLVLDPTDLARVPQTAAVWERVVRKLRAGTMPPAGQPRPEERQREQLARWLQDELDRAAASQPDPGRTEALHRLNRAEYQNAVRDVLGVNVDVTSLLPADDASYGFDNIAGVLKVSQSLMER